MQVPILKIPLSDEAATVDLAAKIAPHLRTGDTLLLSGNIGAGKSTFARALIQSRLGRAEDVPSPTFTIVQVYDHPDGDLWHCDLYRLTDSSEVFELGLDEAFETAICLIEWPDRLADDAPEDALSLAFTARNDGHDVALCANRAWAERLELMDV